MLTIKIIIAIEMAFAILIALGIAIFYLIKLIASETEEMKERKRKNGKY